MIYYFLPTAGIAGGVKVGFQFMEALITLGVPGVVAIPGGEAPQWFASSVPVVERREALERITPQDWAVINWPQDLDDLAASGARLICHMQGTPTMERVFSHPGMLYLTCWEQADRHLKQNFGRDTIPVGISVSRCFFGPGEVKLDNEAAYMPRRGLDIATKAARSLKRLNWRPMDGLDEPQVCRYLQRAGVYLATAMGEQFGLPSLEAMAAGCLVASVPVAGGMEYLRDGYNCLVDEPERLIQRLGEMMHPSQAGRRELMRLRARATAFDYHPYALKRRLAHLLRGPLKGLKD
ncbi:MAG: glycosyltransferase [Proteobacteria bacterium]|nr:glycosyltransferase [Pseudomonadota bacterium]MBU4275231.1 glycosyltransferase [Pseudomonadota bacterium]MBU4382508.1 glycosyltransferase [Pseudomonadota bacterium]MBU4605206.1 glycosyltransferase [Pseudomonadota bacterium]MCG2765025.1 glycosyltransferase [Desulfarculaceae bacterium]